MVLASRMFSSNGLLHKVWTDEGTGGELSAEHMQTHFFS